MKLILALSLLTCLYATSHAQESTAGGTMQTQASWTALQNMLNATNGNVTILRTDVNAMKACGVQKKIWTGTACVNAEVTTPSIDTSLYDKLVLCADKGQFYDKSANTCVNAAGLARWVERGSVSDSGYSGIAKNTVIKKLKDHGATRECNSSERNGLQCYVALGTKCYLPLKCSSRTVGSQDQKTITECSSTYISCN